MLLHGLIYPSCTSLYLLSSMACSAERCWTKAEKTPRSLSHPHPCMQRALLDESLKSRVRAIGVEAELKHKQRQAVVLDKRDMGREWCGW